MHEHATASRPDFDTIWMLIRASRKVEQTLAEILEAVELSPTQLDALMQLENTPALTQAQLARIMFEPPRSAAILVRALERRGLVSRSSARSSSKRLPLELTPEGQVVLSSARRALASSSGLHRYGISSLDGALLHSALQAILANK